MHLVVPSKFTAINLLVLALTLVALSWLAMSQLNFSEAMPPQNSLIRRFLVNLQFQDDYISSSFYLLSQGKIRRIRGAWLPAFALVFECLNSSIFRTTGRFSARLVLFVLKNNAGNLRICLPHRVRWSSSKGLAFNHER